MLYGLFFMHPYLLLIDLGLAKNQVYENCQKNNIVCDINYLLHR